MFGDYADMFMQNVTRHLGAHTTRVDVAFDRYIVEDSIKAGQGEANSQAHLWTTCPTSTCLEPIHCFGCEQGRSCPVFIGCHHEKGKR